MKNILKIVSLVALLGGTLAVSWPDDPPCTGGINPTPSFVHYCHAKTDHCGVWLWNFTTTTTCNVWCCPNYDGTYHFGVTSCGSPVPDGCCSDIHLDPQPDNPPVCPAGGG